MILVIAIGAVSAIDTNATSEIDSSISEDISADEVTEEYSDVSLNVKVDYETHKKLRVVSAIQDRSLDKIVGSIIEYEVGTENNIDTVKLMNEILESVEDKE